MGQVLRRDVEEERRFIVKVYVAGAWVEKEHRASMWMERLRKAGIIITHDWTVDDVACTVLTDAHLPPGERKKRADDDLKGIDDADFVWLLTPNERGASGAWTEFGYALGTLKPVIVSGLAWERTIFTTRANQGFHSDDEAFHFLLHWARDHDDAKAAALASF